MLHGRTNAVTSEGSNNGISAVIGIEFKIVNAFECTCVLDTSNAIIILEYYKVP